VLNGLNNFFLREEKMSRRRTAQKRDSLPDPKYKDKLVARLINVILKDGKKSTAEKICYDAFDEIAEKTNDDPVKVFKKAMDNIKPALEVKSRRVGGATYQVPVEVRQDRRVALALRWLKRYSSSRPGKSMKEKLAAEILDAANNRGTTVKKKEDTHKMAEANKAFAHYRW
jgi:small subunit ribosomal protein S7